MKNFLIELKEGILISLRAIRANKMRSILTTLGIIIGIVAVTTMSTAIVGLREAFISSLASFGNDVLYIDKFEWFGGEDWRYYRNRKDITVEQFEQLQKTYTGYQAMAPNKRTFGRTIKFEDRSVEATLIYGTTEDYSETGNAIPQDGRFINELEVRASRRVCVIGQDISDGLFPNESALGKTIKISGIPFKVVGVLEKQGSGFLGSFSLDGQIIMPLKVFERAFGGRGNLQINVKIKDANKIDEAKEEIAAIFRVIRKVPPGQPNDFAVNQQDVFTDVYDQTVGIIATAGIVITALSLFVGAIGIMNIMFVSVTERTKEIGIRKAIGAKRWSILTQFLVEAAVICLIGGIIGLIISYPLSLVIDQFLPTAMPLDIVFLSLFISAMVGIISGFLPAYKAAKMDPVDALRYE
ncbi:MAG: ABC transporter permease [Melioribacteraceae bacterium]|nr:ABC transporter permease [Melioribacteraceae bacterium]WKZ71211.1 MAG: ABC transporter permease [Melioribacteraceae bacterium]